VVTADEIAVHLRSWMDILRLRDWDIRVRVVDSPWRKSADIKIDETAKTAVLLVNQEPASDNTEEIVVHELVHLKLHGLDQMIEELVASMSSAAL
jgi:hypothetical protein